MDQATPSVQSNTIDSAAAALESTGVMDSILGADDAPDLPETETEQPQIDDVDEVEDEQEGEAPEPDDEPEQEEQDEQPQDDDEQSEQSDEQEQIDLESVDQLAEALEVSQDELLDKLQIKVVIDGQEQSVSLREAQAGYQKDADYRQKTGKLAEERRAFESQAHQQTEQVEYQHTVAANMLQLAEKQLLGELQSDNMDELRQSDPMAWTAKRADLYERQQQLQQAKQSAANAFMQQRQQIEQQKQQEATAALAQEAEQLMTALPDFKEIKPKLDGYLSESLGFSNDDLTSVRDHRLILLAHKAMLYDQSQQRATTAKKKVKLAPKMQKPAPAASKPKNDARTKLTVAKKNLRKSGHIRDAASAIENLI